VPTYGRTIAVPAVCTEELLRGAAEFRTNARIPCLSWKHPSSSAAVCRSSQPKTGMFGSRSADDEALLEAICQTSDSEAATLLIADCRPFVNAAANAVAGGGYESTRVYENCCVEFFEIANIHAVRGGHHRLREAASGPFPPVSIDAEEWLVAVASILEGAQRVAHSVHKRHQSVLVHCSDGWDRTPQITGLAMILLDPYYRTFGGFCVLIEQEWIYMGHKFQQRNGHGSANVEDSQRAPIFLQFLDCVWQIIMQQPSAFEFGEDFLLAINEAVDSCQYGTFLCNSAQERETLAVKESTQSAWTSLLATFRTPSKHYHPERHEELEVDHRKLRVWASCHLQRWGKGGPDVVSDHVLELASEATQSNGMLDMVVASLRGECVLNPSNHTEPAAPPFSPPAHSNCTDAEADNKQATSSVSLENSPVTGAGVLSNLLPDSYHDYEFGDISKGLLERGKSFVSDLVRSCEDDCVESHAKVDVGVPHHSSNETIRIPLKNQTDD